jgi:transposase
MTYFTALDVSLRFVSICIVDDTGQVRYEAKVPAEVHRIVGCLRKFSDEVKTVGFEAGALTQYLTYGLQAAGFEVVCLEARQVNAALAAMRNKTDRNDARGIAQILRTGWYSRVHVKSLESHQIRALLASRNAILKKCVDLENELRGLLRVFGVRLASKVPHGAYDAVVREQVESEPLLARALLPLLEARQMLYRTYLRLDNEVKAIVRHDRICQQLMSVPGVGAITALIRCALYVAAHSLLSRSATWSSLKAWGMRLAKSRGHRRAVVAVARKLAVIMHKMWIEGTEFRWSVQPAAVAK